MKPEWNNFACYTYKKKGSEVCSAHYIRECVLDEVVLGIPGSLPSTSQGGSLLKSKEKSADRRRN